MLLSLVDPVVSCSSTAAISFHNQRYPIMGLHEKPAIQILIPAFISAVKRTKQKSKHTPTALSSASQTWMISSKDGAKLIKSPFRRSPVLGEKPDVITYTQCVCTCVSALCTVRFEGEAAGSLRFGEVRGAVGERLEAAAANVYHITHTCTHTMLLTHFPRQL